jgi:anthranilate phosphoribosyltransferase
VSTSTGFRAPDRLLTSAIDRLANREDLSAQDAAAVLAAVMSGAASEVQIAAFLIALRIKGETVEELAGLARTMREFAAAVRPQSHAELLDTAGTGGGRRTFNVSTTAAIIAAGAGCTVAKHGNRSATGLSGSADLLEALGARIDLDPVSVARCIDEVGFGFMFAPAHHPATRYVIPVRRQLAVRTTFNFLGPLTNPAGATRQLLGVADPTQLPKLAGALALLGTRHALLVCGHDGVDELSISAATHVIEVLDGRELEYDVTPEELSLPRHSAADVPGGDPHQNAAITRAILGGEAGAPRDLAVLNAGAAIYAAGGAPSLPEGVRAAQESIDSGAAAEKLGAFVERTHELARPLDSTR